MHYTFRLIEQVMQSRDCASGSEVGLAGLWKISVLRLGLTGRASGTVERDDQE
jgi:hypothetical protein